MKGPSRSFSTFRHLPATYRQMGNVEHRDYARFYGNYVSRFGQRERFSFQVEVDLSKGGKRLYKSISFVCGRILGNEIPVHEPGQVFSGFSELVFSTPWVRARRVMDYKVGMHYG